MEAASTDNRQGCYTVTVTHYGVHYVKCSVCKVHCLACSAWCALCSVQDSLCIVQWALTVCCVQSTMCSEHCVVCNYIVRCSVCNIQLPVCSVKCAVYSMWTSYKGTEEENEDKRYDSPASHRTQNLRPPQESRAVGPLCTSAHTHCRLQTLFTADHRTVKIGISNAKAVQCKKFSSSSPLRQISNSQYSLRTQFRQRYPQEERKQHFSLMFGLARP